MGLSDETVLLVHLNLIKIFGAELDPVRYLDLLVCNHLLLMTVLSFEIDQSTRKFLYQQLLHLSLLPLLSQLFLKVRLELRSEFFESFCSHCALGRYARSKGRLLGQWINADAGGVDANASGALRLDHRRAHLRRRSTVLLDVCVSVLQAEQIHFLTFPIVAILRSHI